LSRARHPSDPEREEPEELCGKVEHRVRPSRLGKALLGMLLPGAILGMVAGGPLLLISSMGLAALALAWLGAWLHLRALRPEPPRGRTVFVGESFSVAVELHNAARWRWVRDVRIQPGAWATRSSGYLPSLPPGGRGRAELDLSLRVRGLQRVLPITLASTWPLGAFEARAMHHLPVELLALPRLGHVRNVEELVARSARSVIDRRTTWDGSEEFFGLREWREGESQRLVHWKVSARRGRLVRRVLRGEQHPAVHLVLVGRAVGRPGRSGRVPSFEHAVSLAGTLAEHFARNRYRVRFSFLGAAPGPPATLRGRSGLAALLRTLARVEATPVERLPSPSELARGCADRDEVPILVLAGGREGRSELPDKGGDGRLVVLDVDRRPAWEVYRSLRRWDYFGLARRA